MAKANEQAQNYPGLGGEQRGVPFQGAENEIERGGYKSPSRTPDGPTVPTASVTGAGAVTGTGRVVEEIADQGNAAELRGADTILPGCDRMGTKDVGVK